MFHDALKVRCKFIHAEVPKVQPSLKLNNNIYFMDSSVRGQDKPNHAL